MRKEPLHHFWCSNCGGFSALTTQHPLQCTPCLPNAVLQAPKRNHNPWVQIQICYFLAVWLSWKCYLTSLHPVKKWNISCHVSKQSMSQSSAIAALLHVSLRKLKMWKHRILTPDSWGAYERNDFSEHRLLHLSMHGKVLSSLRYLVFVH